MVYKASRFPDFRFLNLPPQHRFVVAPGRKTPAESENSSDNEMLGKPPPNSTISSSSSLCLRFGAENELYHSQFACDYHHEETDDLFALSLEDYPANCIHQSKKKNTHCKRQDRAGFVKTP